MPWPVSETVTRTNARPAWQSCPAVAASSTTDSITMDRSPPSGMASRALRQRLSKTCSIWPLSASATTGCGGSAEINADVFGKQTPDHHQMGGHQAVEINAFPLERLPASEGEKLPGELTGLTDGADDRAERRLAIATVRTRARLALPRSPGASC